MELKKNFILRRIADEAVLVPVGRAGEKLSGLISVNETGIFLWEQLPLVRDENELVARLISEYDVDEPSAREGVADFLCALRSVGVVA